MTPCTKESPENKAGDFKMVLSPDTFISIYTKNYYYHYCFLRCFHAALISVELIIKLRIKLKVQFTCFHFLRTGIADV